MYDSTVKQQNENIKDRCA